MVNYLKVTIGNVEVQVEDPNDLPLSIDYFLENPEDFQQKKSSESFNLKIPPTLINEQVANTFRHPSIVDMTEGEIFRSHQPCVIEANGWELLVGKAFLLSGKHTTIPTGYEYNCYGDNADWQIPLQETTLFDLLKHLNFNFTKDLIIDSWDYDGTDPNLPYVFAPVKYRGPIGGYNKSASGTLEPINDNMLPIYMRPSLSIYFIIYWALKSVGYRIKSDFFDSEYFRRKVMPWSWGNFLDSDGTRLTAHNFLAKSLSDVYYNSPDGSHSFIWDLKVSNDNSNGAFDNNDDYSYNAATKAMTWEYKNNADFGTLEATFATTIQVDSTVAANSDCELRVQWFKNGVMFDGGWGAYGGNGNTVMAISAPAVGRRDEVGIKELWATVTVNPGDIITAKIYLHTFKSKSGRANILANVLEFKLAYFKIPIGGTIDFQNYTGLKKYKFLDLLRGVIDAFNISINTDSINKVVVMEPTFDYSLTNDLTETNEGYFVNDHINWDGKEDLSKEWEMVNFSDYEREFMFKFKDDQNDGILKIIQDRNVNTLAASKYVFPQRFKTGKKEFENRFFSPVMHYEVDEWKTITGEAPQLVCMIPENISGTSNSEATNTFVPKMCHYKGLIEDVGGWRFDGEDKTELPFMFAVNYKLGGENDPVLSYCDEKIKSADGYVIGHGLMKRFFWQRLAIIRNGQFYNTWFKLNHTDVAGNLHREYKSFLGHKWTLIQIKSFRPLIKDSTACLLYKWAPVVQTDADNSFPSADVIINGTTPDSNSLDIKYAQLKCLTSDIPNS